MSIPLEALLAASYVPQAFPHAPFVAAACSLLAGPHPDLPRIEGLLSLDVTAFRSFLRAASAGGLKAETFSQAVQVLGMGPARTLLAEMASKANGLPQLDPVLAALAGEELWPHHLQTALLCHLLAQATGYPNPAVAFTAGLIHDVGRPLLRQYDYVALSEVFELDTEPADLVLTIEDRAVGHSHARVGGAWLRHLRAPASIVEAVTWHHQPRGSTQKLAKLLHLADVAIECHLAHVPIGIRLFPLDATVLHEAGFRDVPLADLASQAHELFLSLEAHAATLQVPEAG